MPLMVVNTYSNFITADPIFEFVTSQNTTGGNILSVSYPSIPFGAVEADRRIHLIVVTIGDVDHAIESISVGDDAAPALDGSADNNTHFRKIHAYRANPTGASGTIDITFNATNRPDRVLVGIYRSNGAVVPFQVNKMNSASQNFNAFGLETPPFGFILGGAASSGNTASPRTHSFNILNKDASDDNGGSPSAAWCASVGSLINTLSVQKDRQVVTSVDNTSLGTTSLGVSYKPGASSAVPSINWTTVFDIAALTAGSNTGANANATVRGRIPFAALSSIPVTPTHIRVTLRAHSGAEGFGWNKAYIGHGAVDTIDAVDLQQLLFGTLPNLTLAPRELRVSDPLAFAYDEISPLQLSMQLINDAANDQLGTVTVTGAQLSRKADVDEAAVLDVSGYTSILTNGLGPVYRIELGVAAP